MEDSLGRVVNSLESKKETDSKKAEECTTDDQYTDNQQNPGLASKSWTAIVVDSTRKNLNFPILEKAANTLIVPVENPSVEEVENTIPEILASRMQVNEK